MLLLYTVCVVKRGRASIKVFFSSSSFFFLNFNTKRLRKKNKHDVSGSISVEKPKPVAFLCCKLNFYFHIHLWFLQALKQDNKRICSNVQLFSHFNSSQSNVASVYRAALSIATIMIHLFCCSFVSLCIALERLHAKIYFAIEFCSSIDSIIQAWWWNACLFSSNHMTH